MGGKNRITSPSMHINTPGTSHSFCKPWRPFCPPLVPHALCFRVSPFAYLACFLPLNSGLASGVCLLQSPSKNVNRWHLGP